MTPSWIRGESNIGVVDVQGMSCNGFLPNHIRLLTNRRRHRDRCRLCSARAARVATKNCGWRNEMAGKAGVF